MSDELLELPEGWEWVTLGELCEIARGGSPRPIKQFLTDEPEGVNWIKISDASASSKYIYETKEKIKTDGIKYSRLVNEGDFILSNSMSFGRPYIMRTSGCIHDGWLVLKDKYGLFDQDYLYYFLGSDTTYKQFDQLAAGSTVRNLNIDLAKEVKVALPPLNEQKRLVAKIEELNNRTQKAKEALEAIPELCDRFRQSVLAAAFRGDLTADWREQNPDVEPASVLLERIKKERRQKWEEEELKRMQGSGKQIKDDKWKERYKESQHIDTFNLPELPNAWSWASVEQFADVGTGATPLRSEPKFYENGTIPWITSGALNNLFIDNAEEFITPVAIQETNAKIFPKYTLLVAMYGEGKTRGKISELLIEAATNQACAALILEGIANKIQPLVKLFFQKNYNDIRRLASGGVQPNLNLNMIKSTLVPIPPLQEQAEIIQTVSLLMSIIEAIEKQHQQATEKLDKLNQSILAKAFRGELVPQDPEDEPASILLERIRTEREKLNNSKPKTPRTSKRKTKQPEPQETIPGLE